RVRVTRANPAYGHVEGLMRGYAPWALRRSRPIHPPKSDGTKCSARFARLIEDLAIRSESVAAETGCWLFLGAHHPGATLPPVHYSSPRLREDDATGADDLGGAFLKITTALWQSRRREALDLSKALRQLEGEQEQVVLEKDRAEALVSAY
ncbi:hypothetical protein JB92DRAFT_2590145, partial [Gautieria morchelliformis]